MNWHGKALGAKSAEVLEHLKAKLISPTFEAEVKVIHYFKLMNIEYCSGEDVNFDFCRYFWSYVFIRKAFLCLPKQYFLLQIHN